MYFLVLELSRFSGNVLGIHVSCVSFLFLESVVEEPRRRRLAVLVGPRKCRGDVRFSRKTQQRARQFRTYNSAIATLVAAMGFEPTPPKRLEPTSLPEKKRTKDKTTKRKTERKILKET